MATPVKLFSMWWRQPERFDWLSEYLASRRLLGVARILYLVTLFIIVVLPALTLLAPPAPTTAVERGLLGLTLAGIAGCIVFWLRISWPTRRQSAVFAIVLTLLIAINALAQPTPTMALIGSALFASPLVYVGCMHTSRQLAIIVPLSVGCACTAIARVSSGDVAQALWMLIIMLIAFLAAPIACQILIYALGSDAVRSDIDALTDLHNRRGFFRGAHDLIARSPGVPIAAVMVDLDNFKRVNDTAGHAAGDQVIAAVATALQQTVDHAAVVGRAGGEEFLIATTRRDAELDALAERIRRVVEAMPAAVTASVGVATTPTNGPADPAGLVDRLINDADTAMYIAKRAGGNQVYRMARSTARREGADESR
ncbi:MAG: GGDEF domain-containing protein [Mycobacterium sp.]